MNQNTAVSQRSEFLTLLSSKNTDTQLAAVLPPSTTVEKFKRVCRTAFLRNDFLQKMEPGSIMLSIMTLASLGLEPDGRKAHLVPFKGKCVPIPGYLGYIARAQENGIRSIHFDNVFMNDVFEWEQRGNGLHYRHAPDFRNPDRGEMFASYCIWKEATDDALHGVIMPKMEIDKIRAASPAANSGPWVSHYFEMTKKTIIRRAQKQWPLDVKMDELVATGKMAATVDIDVDTMPESPEPPEPPQNAEPDSAVSHAGPSAPAETPAQLAKRMTLDAQVPFDGFMAEVTARKIAKEDVASTWPDYEAVPSHVWTDLGAQQKAFGMFLKKFGKK